MFELWLLWATILDHFGTFGGPFGVPGSSLGSFVHTFWAALSPKVQNVCKMWFPNPKGVTLGDQFWHLFCIFFKKKRVRGECWLAGRFFCSFSWFSGSLDPPSAAACAVQSQFFMFGVTLENVSFLHTFWCHFGVIWAHLFMFLVFFFRA